MTEENDLFFFAPRAEIGHQCHSAARWPQPKRASPCSPTLQSLNTETTEDLSDLCVKFFLVTEDTEALLARGEIFARRQENWE